AGGGLFLFLHAAIGVSGAWRFVKEEGVSDAGALIAAAGFGACGFAASLSVYWNHFGAWAYFPWIAALARSGLRSRGAQAGLAAAAGVVLAMAGAPGSWLRALPFLDRIRYPAKALAWTFFALPMLAGLGADELRFDRGKRRAVVLVASGIVGLALLLFSSQPV